MKKIITIIIAIGTTGALAIFGITLLRTTVRSVMEEELVLPAGRAALPEPIALVSEPPAQERSTEAAVISADPSMRLVIPALDIDARVQEVGLTKSGKMGVPNNFTDVGWYKHGAIPGQAGSAVFAGHVDNGLALPGVFKHLEDLQVGDSVYVETKTGERMRFIVTKQAVYPKDASAPEVFQMGGEPMIRLITCTGSWLPADRTHDSRLVVTAILDRSS